jgi:hypothetical protein
VHNRALEGSYGSGRSAPYYQAREVASRFSWIDAIAATWHRRLPVMAPVQKPRLPAVARVSEVLRPSSEGGKSARTSSRVDPSASVAEKVKGAAAAASEKRCRRRCHHLVSARGPTRI